MRKKPKKKRKPLVALLVIVVAAYLVFRYTSFSDQVYALYEGITGLQSESSESTDWEDSFQYESEVDEVVLEKPTVAQNYTELSNTDPWTPGVCQKPKGWPTKIDSELWRRLTNAQKGAKAAGLSLTLTSGYRNWETQAELYADKVEEMGSVAQAREWVLPPQESRHVQGQAIDVGNYEAAVWLKKNSSKYGLCQAYANEWWHFEKGVIGKACPAPIASSASLPKQECPK